MKQPIKSTDNRDTKKFDIKEWQSKSLNEGNSYYDLKQQYYEISDNIGQGGIVDTLKDIARKKDVEEFDKLGMGAFAKEVKIWTSIQKLFNQSKLGKIL
jgi:hypothetical protein